MMIIQCDSKVYFYVSLGSVAILVAMSMLTRYDNVMQRNPPPQVTLDNRQQLTNAHSVFIPSTPLDSLDNNVGFTANSTHRSRILMADQITPKRLPQFKNPCWLTSKNDGLRRLLCIPYVYLAGFPKCGTTDLHSRFTSHPLIVSPWSKEQHYLTRQLSAKTKCDKKWLKAANTSCIIYTYATTYFRATARAILYNTKTGYGGPRISSLPGHSNLRLWWAAKDKNDRQDTLSAHMELIFKNEWRKVRAQARQSYKFPMITIDGSASTIWDNHHLNIFEENAGHSRPQMLISDLVLRMNPDARIIVILRDPVARSYSDYSYFKITNTSQKEFHDLSKKSITAFNSCMERKQSVKVCAYEMGAYRKRPGRLAVGIYYVHIADWLIRLPPNRLLVLRMEDYETQMIPVLRRVYRFLGLPQLSDYAMTYIKTRQTKNTNKRKTKLGPMWPQTQTMLEQFYAPHNQKLVELLGDDRFNWKDVRRKKLKTP